MDGNEGFHGSRGLSTDSHNADVEPGAPDIEMHLSSLVDGDEQMEDHGSATYGYEETEDILAELMGTPSSPEPTGTLAGFGYNDPVQYEELGAPLHLRSSQPGSGSTAGTQVASGAQPATWTEMDARSGGAVVLAKRADPPGALSPPQRDQKRRKAEERTALSDVQISLDELLLRVGS